MKIFLSWSGIRSKFVAEALRGWLPRVIQSIKPWMSDEDISAGSRWLSNVSSELSVSQFGIICVTPENQNNPWLLFEAGALSKVIDQAHVCPFLLDLTPGQLTGPLSQFQASQVGFDGALRIIQAINRLSSPNNMPDVDLEEIFGVWWPKLEEKVNNTPKIADSVPRRAYDDILEELISNTREQIRRENLRITYQSEEAAKMEKMMEVMQRTVGTVQKLPTIIDALVTSASLTSQDITSASVRPTSSSGLTDIQQLLGPSGLSDFQQVIATAKSAAESHRAFANDVLKTERPDETDDTPSNE